MERFLRQKLMVWRAVISVQNNKQHGQIFNHLVVQLDKKTNEQPKFLSGNVAKRKYICEEEEGNAERRTIVLGRRATIQGDLG